MGLDNNFGKRGNLSVGSSQSTGQVEISTIQRSKSRQRMAVYVLVAVIVYGLLGYMFSPQDKKVQQGDANSSGITETMSAAYPTASVGKMWVTSDRLKEYSCQSTTCGSSGYLFFREAVQVEEIQVGWARITPFHSVLCFNGQIEVDIDEGNKACTTANGVVDGKIARWVESKFLSSDRPADPAANASGTAKLIGGSDDFRLYEKAFVAAAEGLMTSGACTEDQIAESESGGFRKSQNMKGPYYFIYCSGPGLPVPLKFYLNAETGSVSQGGRL